MTQKRNAQNKAPTQETAPAAPTQEVAPEEDIVEQPEEPVKPVVKMKTVKLLRDYWPAENNRLSKGQVVELPLDEAKKLLQENKIELHDPDFS